MEKEINARMFQDIVTKYSMFDNLLSMSDNLLVRKNLLKTIESYTVDNKVNFDFIDLKTVYESDYYKDYDGSLYKDKKPPFVCALLENLMKDTNGLHLAQYYVEPLVNNIMTEAKSKAKTVTNLDQVIDINFTVYSTELIVTSHMVLPPEFSDLLISMFNESKVDLNTLEGQAEFSQYAASKYNFVHLSKEQNELLLFQDGGKIMFGEINENDHDYSQVRDKYKDIVSVSDDTTLIMIDKYTMVELLETSLGKNNGKKIVEQFIAQCPWTLLNVPSSEYNVKFTPNSEKFKLLEENKDYSKDINPIFTLKEKGLDNVLNEKNTFKI